MDESPTPATGEFLTGQLLIAMPTMEDPRFAQSVIYVCAHTPEGAMGLVLNGCTKCGPIWDDWMQRSRSCRSDHL